MMYHPLTEKEQKRIRTKRLCAMYCWIIGIIFIVLFFWASIIEAKPIDTGLWLARSCVGEAGWDSYQTGECAAIMHIYKKRQRITRKSLYWVAKQYSAAIKNGRHQRNKWIFDLERDGKRPKRWPTNVSWELHKSKWKAMLDHVDDFMMGKVADPLPHADHYGGHVDAFRARKAGWYRLRAQFRNDFYSIEKPND